MKFGDDDIACVRYDSEYVYIRFNPQVNSEALKAEGIMLSRKELEYLLKSLTKEKL